MITKTHILYNNHRHHRYNHQAGRPAPPYLPLVENGQRRELAARWRRDDRLRQAVARERPRYADTLRSQLDDKDAIIKAKDDLIATIRQQLAQARVSLSDYPFPLGVADRTNIERKPQK